MTRRGRKLAWIGAAVGALLTAGLIVLVVFVDLETANQVAGIVGAIVSLAALGVSVYALLQPLRPDATGPVNAAEGTRSVVAGRDITGRVSTGDGDRRATSPGPASPAPPDSGPVPGGTTRASGDRSVAAGRDISGDVATGDSNTGGSS
ncbi:hypothetical protein [Streptomyces scopuliridis]|uniref:hypothetical protein n=1 Tax=Streptomyces scopuliridis TaxID=452529 RepID=UPI0036A85773